MQKPARGRIFTNIGVCSKTLTYRALYQRCLILKVAILLVHTKLEPAHMTYLAHRLS